MNVDVNNLILGLGDLPENNNIQIGEELMDILLQCAKQYINHPKALKVFANFLGRIDMNDSSRIQVGFSRSDMVNMLNDKHLNGIKEVTEVLTAPCFFEKNYEKNGKTITPKVSTALIEAGWVEINGEVDHYVVGVINTNDRKAIFYKLAQYYGSKLGIFLKVGNSKNDGRAMVFYLYLLKNKFKKEWSESIDELKKLLGCPLTITNIKFRQQVLTPICTRINHLSNLTVSVENQTSDVGSSHKSVAYIISCKEKILLNEKPVTESDYGVDLDLIKEKIKSPAISKISDIVLCQCYREIETKLSKRLSGEDLQNEVCKIINRILDNAIVEDKKKREKGDKIRSYSQYLKGSVKKYVDGDKIPKTNPRKTGKEAGISLETPAVNNNPADNNESTGDDLLDYMKGLPDSI